MNPLIALRHAFRALLRERQHGLRAIGCVAVGVLSIVGLQQLSSMVSSVMLTSPRVQLGADLRLFHDDLEAQLDSLQALEIPRATLLATTRAILMKDPRSGATTLVSRAWGIDPATCPLRGRLTLAGSATLTDALAPVGSAVITRDLARRFELRSGDAFQLFGAPDAPPVQLEVAAIATDMPDRNGMGVYFSLATARALGLGGANELRACDVGERPRRALESRDWTIREIPEHADDDAARLFGFMLGGAGMLGLLLSGIGVSNTMQVVLARRRDEIATLKALGYRRSHLLALFGAEALLLGCAGSLLGAPLGLGFAALLMQVLNANTAFLLQFEIDPLILLSGCAVGIATTLLFAMAAIVQAAQWSPATLLRGAESSVDLRARRSWWLHASLLILFALLSSLVLGSLRYGFGVVAGGVLGLLLVAALLRFGVYLIVRMPSGPYPLLRFARRHLRHAAPRAVFGLTALFAGVLAIGLSMVVLRNLQLRLEPRQPEVESVPMRIYSSAADRDVVAAALARSGATSWHEELHAALEITHFERRLRLREVVGRADEDLRWNLALRDSATVAEDGVYLMDTLAQANAIDAGDTLVLHGAKSSHSVRVAGIFERRGSAIELSAPPQALLVPIELLRELEPERSTMQWQIVGIELSSDSLAADLQKVAPNSVVLGAETIQQALDQLFRGLFWFATSIASLALLAGAVLIANAVGLAMLERKREIAILKAVGFGSRHVLGTIALENLLGGLVGGGTALLMLALGIPVLNRLAPAAELRLRPDQALWLLAIALLCAVGAALAVAWQPSRARPLSVLRDG